MDKRYIPCTDLLDLSSWTKSSTIVALLEGKIDATDVNRKFRSDVAVNNRMYLNGEADHYIVHGARGYKWAETEEEIERSVKDLERRAYTMLTAASQTRKALRQKDQGAFNNLAEVRKEKKMTAEELVSKVRDVYPGLGLDASLLSKIENNKVLPNHMTMVAISEALGVGAVKLFGASAFLI